MKIYKHPNILMLKGNFNVHFTEFCSSDCTSTKSYSNCNIILLEVITTCLYYTRVIKKCNIVSMENSFKSRGNVFLNSEQFLSFSMNCPQLCYLLRMR